MEVKEVELREDREERVCAKVKSRRELVEELRESQWKTLNFFHCHAVGHMSRGLSSKQVDSQETSKDIRAGHGDSEVCSVQRVTEALGMETRTPAEGEEAEREKARASAS